MSHQLYTQEDLARKRLKEEASNKIIVAHFRPGDGEEKNEETTRPWSIILYCYGYTIVKSTL